MPKWPVNQKNAEGVYAINECNHPSAGRYPVGQNGCWHSGIHINALDSGTTHMPVYPIIGGELAAYRIFREDKRVPRLKEITAEEFSHLAWYEQKLYIKDTKRPANYKLKDSFTAEEKKYLDEKYAAGFMLIKHSVRIQADDEKQSSSAGNPLIFFTLYANIRPFAFPDNFSKHPEIAFYQRCIFRVVEQARLRSEYPANNDEKLFPGSCCTVKEKENGNYLCRFDNTGAEIELPPGDIEICVKAKYQTQEAGVPIYDPGHPSSKIGTLKKNVEFCSSVEKCENGFFKVKIFAADVEDAYTTDYALVEAVKLKEVENAKGYLKESSYLLDRKVKGLLVYDRNSITSGNARAVLKAGTEFYLEKQELFTGKQQEDFAAFRTRDNQTAGYIYYKRSETANPAEDIEAAAFDYDPDYTYERTAVPSAPKRLSTNDILGASAGAPREKVEHYDLALLLNDISFYESSNKRFTVFAALKDTLLYTRKYPQAGTYVFPGQTVFEVVSQNDTACHLKLKSILMFFWTDSFLPHAALSAKPLDFNRIYLPDPVSAVKIVYGDSQAAGNSIASGRSRVIENKNPHTQAFADAFAKVKNMISRANTSPAGSINGNDQFRVEFTHLPDFTLEFWIRAEDFKTLTASGADVKTGGKAELLVYKEDPSAYTRFEKTGRLPEEFISRKAPPEVKDKDGTAYARLYKDGDAQYIKKADVTETNLLDWKKHFKKLDTESDSNFTGAGQALKRFLLDREADNDGDIYYDGDINYGHETAIYYDYDEYGKWYDAQSDSKDQKRKEQIRRTIICRHPLEWDKTLYLDGDKVRPSAASRFGIPQDNKDREDHFKKVVTDVDIWNELKDQKIEGLDLAANNFWFAHPVYFINHLEKMGAFDFNPYQGQRLKHPEKKIDPATDKLINIDFTVRDNPGFAPYAEKGEFSGYLRPTSYFNQDFWSVHEDDPEDDPGKEPGTKKWKNYYYHEGIDFGCAPGTEIRSLIHGTVMLAGTHEKKHDRGMGDFMIVQDMEDKLKYYILVHIGRESWKEFGIGSGKTVSPEQPVARVWHADADEKAGRDNYHLHISVVRSTEYNKNNVLYTSGDFINGDGKIIDSNYSFPVWKYPEQFLNPFYQQESWKGRV
jgi:hypothetical protein